MFILCYMILINNAGENAVQCKQVFEWKCAGFQLKEVLKYLLFIWKHMKFAYGCKLTCLRHICILGAEAFLLFECWQCNADLLTKVTAAVVMLSLT